MSPKSSKETIQEKTELDFAHYQSVVHLLRLYGWLATKFLAHCSKTVDITNDIKLQNFQSGVFTYNETDLDVDYRKTYARLEKSISQVL